MKSKFLKVVTFVYIVIFCCLITFMTTYNYRLHTDYDEKASDFYSDHSGKSIKDDGTLDFMISYVNEYFIGDPVDWNKTDSYDDIYRSYVNSLNDPYAYYYSPEEYDALYNSIEGNYVGIGVTVSFDERNNDIFIITVAKDSPAESAGLLPGDRITAVSGKNVADIGYEDAIDLIRGEEGTSVTLTATRNDKEFICTMVRKKGEGCSVIYQIINNKIGLIRLLNFDLSTPSQFNEAIDSFESSGIHKIIIDLRNNPGGQLSSVLDILSYVLPKDDVLVRIYDKNNKEEVRKSTLDHTVEGEIVLLINNNTASAAELFTGTLHDYNKAITVGTLSYGKGCMQTIINLPNGGAFKFTFRMYNPPLSDNYDEIGITPDYVVELDEGLTDNVYLLSFEEDNQLQFAINLLDK